MTTIAPHPWSVRRQFVNGALLTSGDLEREAAREASLRAIHVRGAHDTWGIALGMRVWVNSARTRVLVSPGLAYDAHGAELYSSHPILLDVPTRVAGAVDLTLDLLVRRRDVSSSLIGKSKCPDRALAIAERPEWRWSFAGQALYGTDVPFADDIRLGADIPVARFRVAPNNRVNDIDLSVRRTARRMTRPHVSGGRVLAGSIPVVGSIWHWSATIDTTTGGFSSAKPRYMARLAGHPLIAPTAFAAFAEMNNAPSAHSLLGPLVSLRNESARSFVIDVRVATNTSAHFRNAPAAWLAEAGKTLPVDVTWSGCEDVQGCPPALRAPLFDANDNVVSNSFSGFSAAAALASAVVIDPTV